MVRSGKRSVGTLNRNGVGWTRHHEGVLRRRVDGTPPYGEGRTGHHEWVLRRGVEGHHKRILRRGEDGTSRMGLTGGVRSVWGKSLGTDRSTRSEVQKERILGSREPCLGIKSVTEKKETSTSE